MAEDTWTARALPVLETVAAMAEERAHLEGHPRAQWFDAEAVAQRTDLPRGSTITTVRELWEGGYLEGSQGTTASHGWYLSAVRLTAAGRRAVGQWPQMDDPYTDLLAYVRERAEAEADPEKRKALQVAARRLADLAQALGAGLMTEWLKRRFGF